MTERASFSVEAMVRGYHPYKDIRTAVSGRRGATLPTGAGESQPSGPVRCGSAEGPSDRRPRP